ncbi:efflux RND transporter periplasmic adaptor subunit, partial [bacterium]|nr:efflux RND transporter periplasmic adaptor subunit [bacterium]
MFSKLFKLSKPLFKWTLGHKLIASISLLVIIFGGYFIYKAISGKEEQVRYMTATVEKSTLITSVSGTGQVSSSELIDIKPDVSGNVVYIGAQKGQEVKAGVLLVQIDSSDAQKAVRDAETSLETAKLELDKLLEPVDELDLLRAENNLAQAKESKQKAEDNIVEAYEDAFNAIANAFLDLPTIIIGLNKVLYSYGIADSEKTADYWNISALANSVDTDNRSELEEFIDSAEDDYKAARTKYNENFENYKDASRYSE